MANKIEIENIDDYEIKGMIFEKTVCGVDVSKKQAEECFEYCQYICRSQKTDPKEFESFKKYIKRTFDKARYSKEDTDKFIKAYIEDAVFPTGEPHLLFFSPNNTDLKLFREMLAVFYKKIYEPRLAAAVNGGERR